jgi:hypothetical protein
VTKEQHMSNQPEDHSEESQDANLTPPPPPEYNPTQPAQGSPENIPPAQDSIPPSYDQPAAYQQPAYTDAPPPSEINPYGDNVPPPSSTDGVPPYGQAPYNYQQSRYGDALPPSNPLPLGEAIRQLPAQYWRVLTHPNAATFVAEEGKAAWNIIWVQLIIIAVIGAIFSAIGAVASTSIINSLGASTSNASMAALRSSPAISSIYALIGTFIGFFIGTGIFHLIAKAFRGQGNFLRYAYCTLLITAPISIVNDIISLIPILGSLVVFALGIYEIVLLIFMTMGVHRLPGGRATLVILLPVIVIFVLIVALVIILVVVAVNSVPH